MFRRFVCLFLCFWIQSAVNQPIGQGGGEVFTCESVNALRETNLDSSGPWRVFNQLSIDELDEVMDFLVEDAGLYHIARSSVDVFPTTSGPNLLHRIELLEPNKAEVLEYLDNDGPVPERFAKAYVIRSEQSPKDVMEYKVGPLPLNIGDRKPRREIGVDGDDSPVYGVVMQKLREDGEIPYYKRPADVISSTWSAGLISQAAYTLRKIFKDTTGWCFGEDTTDAETLEQSRDECGRGLIEWLNYPALDRDTSKRIMHIIWFFKTRNGGGDEMYFHPIPISFKVEEGDVDEQNWRLFGFEYCHQGPYDSPEELLEAYENGDLVRCVAEDWKDYNYDESWSQTNNRKRFRNGSERAAPRTFYPNGRRFETQVENEEIGNGIKFEYLGWEGHVSVRFATGIVLHDIRFRGNRIVYELALQDQYVAYSGYAGIGQTVYMDSFFGLGLNMLSMRRGVDCPETAQFFPMVKMGLAGSLDTLPDVICIFEEDAQAPEWRHTHYNGTNDEPHADAVRRSSLVVRAVASVGNYDYLYSIRFKPDASIEVETTLAGYMLTSFFDVDGQTSSDAPFGTRVHKHSFATLHDHLSGWKVDLDVLGTQNTMHRLTVKAGTWEEALEKGATNGGPPPLWHEAPVVKYIERRRLAKEFGYRISDPGTVIHAFANNRFTNSWGLPRGYAIIHGMTTRQLLPDSHPFTKAAAWTKYHLAITQRKENETLSHAAIYDTVAPGNPVTSLDHYINGEDIDNEDLVAWVMMGVIHIPRSEDVPLISNFGTQFFIKPWNYYDELESMDIGNVQSFDACYPDVGNSYDYGWAFLRG